MPDIIVSKPQNIVDKNTESVAWQAEEYDYKRKSNDWFWSVGVVSIALIVVSIILKNLLFIILVVLGGFSIFLYGARKPKVISFALTPQGVKVANKIYDYANLKSFWIEYNPPHRKELMIESKKTLMPLITIMLGETDPNEIREYLLRFLKEEKIEESFITTISRLIGF